VQQLKNAANAARAQRYFTPNSRHSFGVPLVEKKPATVDLNIGRYAAKPAATWTNFRLDKFGALLYL
jgi:hypothetical protein